MSDTCTALICAPPGAPKKITRAFLIPQSHHLQLAITEAFRLGRASSVAPLEYSALAWGVGLDWLLWRTLPDYYTLLGAAIIIASGVYLVRREAVHAECEHP